MSSSSMLRGAVATIGAISVASCGCPEGEVYLEALDACVVNDTCTGGENMTDPQLVGDLTATAAGHELVITWDEGTGAGAELGADYFSAGTVNAVPAGVTLVLSYDDPRQLTLSFTGLAAHFGSDVSITLSFPDREAYTSCEHPAMSDEYLLRINLSLTAAGEVSGASFSEVILLGGF